VEGLKRNYIYSIDSVVLHFTLNSPPGASLLPLNIVHDAASVPIPPLEWGRNDKVL